MKNANTMPPYPADQFMGKTYDSIEAHLLYASIELNLYKHLKTSVFLDEVVKKTGYHKKNLKLLLNALTAMKFIKKEDDKYISLPETDYYLNSDSEMYLGDHILYWRDMTSLDNVVELVKKGPLEKNFDDENGSDFFDFRSMGQGARNVMYLGRVQNLIASLNLFFDKDACFKTFDMGAGSGIMSIEIVKNFPNASATVFDQAQVIGLTKEIIGAHHVEDKIEVQTGNFVTDEFEGQYDLIITAGVLDFVGDLEKMLLKLKGSLADEGYIYVVTHGVNDNFTGPKPFILGWLSSHLNGLDVLKSDPYIREAIHRAGFEIIHEQEAYQSYMVRKKR